MYKESFASMNTFLRIQAKEKIHNFLIFNFIQKLNDSTFFRFSAKNMKLKNILKHLIILKKI